jgi:hypothetical protein
MNPLRHLLPALYAVLATPPLTASGAAVLVYEHLPKPESSHYVLLEQPTATGAAGSRACLQWSCTALVDVITQFVPSLISSGPVDELADEIAQRVEHRTLALPAGYQCGPATLELHSEVRESDGELVAVRRLLRFRWDVFYTPS